MNEAGKRKENKGIQRNYVEEDKVRGNGKERKEERKIQRER